MHVNKITRKQDKNIFGRQNISPSVTCQVSDNKVLNQPQNTSSQDPGVYKVPLKRRRKRGAAGETWITAVQNVYISPPLRTAFTFLRFSNIFKYLKNNVRGSSKPSLPSTLFGFPLYSLLKYFKTSKV